MIPSEIKNEIIKYLSFNEINKCLLLSKEWNDDIKKYWNPICYKIIYKFFLTRKRRDLLDQGRKCLSLPLPYLIKYNKLFIGKTIQVVYSYTLNNTWDVWEGQFSKIFTGSSSSRFENDTKYIVIIGTKSRTIRNNKEVRIWTYPENFNIFLSIKLGSMKKKSLRIVL